MKFNEVVGIIFISFGFTMIFTRIGITQWIGALGLFVGIFLISGNKEVKLK